MLSVLLLCHVVFVVTDFGTTPWSLASPINRAGFLSSQDELGGTIFAFGDNQNMSYWVQGLSRFFPQPLHSSSTMTHPPCKIAQRRGEATFLSNSKVLHQADPECHHLTEPQSRLPDTLEDSERLQAQHIWVPEPSGLWHNISSNNKEIRIGIDQTDPALLR